MEILLLASGVMNILGGIAIWLLLRSIVKNYPPF
jgi:energy-converting hydrogenase Eha subunit C